MSSRGILSLAVLTGCHALEISQNPVSRVVDLLKGLSDKIEEEGKTEENMYEKFVCWGKTTISAKEASNKKAASRIDSLKTYLADIDAGRIEFTSERTDLVKELQTLNSDIETATALRAKEKGDCEKAKAEMEQAIDAMKDAAEVLKEATKDNKKSGLLALKTRLRTTEGFAARSAEARRLTAAADIGDRFLKRGDAHFLRRILTGEVPTVDWKKLNRKATFKKGYETRSGGIQETLKKLLKEFETNLKEADGKEEEAEKTYDDLMKSKEAEKKEAEDALTKSDKETGAKGQSKDEAQNEVDDLEEQVTNDKKYIKETQDALDKKKDEWRARLELRTGELEAVSKAIGVLHSDDARDLMKKSFSSQGGSFLQLTQASSRSHRAAAELRKAAAATSDERLATLAARIMGAVNFDKVYDLIDKMVTALEDEEAEEVETKDKCEKARDEDTMEAAVASRVIDEKQDSIDDLEVEIKDIEKDILEKQLEVNVTKQELKEAKEMRAQEKKAYDANKVDDQAALELVKEAKKILEDFYKEKGLMLAQKKRELPAAGEAPEPPPDTWEKAEYGGKTSESEGIIGIMAMIGEDIVKDIEEATAAEESAIEEYTKMKEAGEKNITDLEDSIGELEQTKSDKEEEISTLLKEQATKHEELEAVVEKLKDAQSGCDYISVNYPLRKKNREIEIKGLKKAKTILQEASKEASLLQRATIKRA